MWLLQVRGVIALLSLVSLALLFTSVMEEDYHFSPSILTCRLTAHQASPTAQVILGLLFFGAPITANITLNLVILLKNLQKTDRSQRQKDTTMTMFVVCVMTSLAYLPLTLLYIVEVLGVFIPPWCKLAGLEVMYLSVALHPVVYFIANSGFRRFVLKGSRSLEPREATPEPPKPSSADELKALPTTSAQEQELQLKEDKGFFARAYAEAIRKSSTTQDLDENFEFYFAA